MRILFVVSNYLPNVGGLQNAVRELGRQLKALRHEIKIVTNRYPRSLPAAEEIDGLSVERLQFLYPALRHVKMRRLDLFLAGLYYLPVTLARLVWAIRRYQPQVVNLHFLGAPSLFVLLASYLIKFPLVVSLHGDDVESLGHKTAFERWVFKAVLRRASFVTTCSHHLMQEAVAIEPAVAAKNRVIHNGVDAERFKKTKSYNHPRPYLLSVGRLTPKKGFDFLIRVFSKIADRYPHLDLIIAGCGSEQASLSELVRMLRLQDRVLLYGQASATEVAELLSGCAFMVIPSRLEAFGLVALEAMAAGKAVLAADVGGLPEILADAQAELFTPGSHEELATALKKWLDNIETIAHRGQENRRRADEFSWKAAAARYEAVYRNRLCE